jgi:hypothetical protein
MDTKYPRGARRSLLVVQALIVPLLFFAPSIVSAQILPNGFPRIERGAAYDSASFAISDTSRLRVIAFTGPELSFSKDAAALLSESRREFAALGRDSFPGKLALSGSSSMGLMLMPNYPDYEYSTIAEIARAKAEKRETVPILRSDLEKGLALASYSLRGRYGLIFRAPKGRSISLDAENDLSLRLAYNFLDLAPTIDYLKEGRTIAQALASHYTGTSFSRLKDEASASLSVVLGKGRILRAEASIAYTDLLYEDHRLGLSFSWEPGMELAARYSSASYASYNGIRPGSLGLSFAASLASSASFELEAVLEPLGTGEAEARLKLSLALPAARGGGAGSSAVDRSYFIGEGGSGSEELKLAQRSDAAVDRDIHAILDIRDRSFGEVVDLLYTYRKSLYRYDYERAVDPFAADRIAGSDPREFLDSGGVCVDAARFIGTVLDNNSIEARTVLIQPLGGSVHSFVVAEDADGSYYAVDGFASATRIEAAASFSEAAAFYSRGFAQLVTRNLEGRVDAVLVSPDIAALDEALGY